MQHLTSIIHYLIDPLTLSSCQRFSMGLASGISGGVCHQFTPFVAKNSFANQDVCLGSLSCIKRWPPLYSRQRSVGRRALSKIWVYRVASIFPSKIHISVGPYYPIPAHSWTLTGCLVSGFGRGHTPFFLQQNLLGVSSCMAVSSVQTTFVNSSLSWSQAHFSRFSLLASRISWQYADPQ